MNTKRLGNIGEIKTISKLVEMQIPVYQAFGDIEKADIVAEFNGKLNKIQIKSSTQTSEDVTQFKISKTRINRNENVTSYYTKNEVDYFALYSVVKDQIYLVSFEDSPSVGIPIRHTKPKNNQIDRAKMDYDYLIDNFDFK